MPGKFRLTKENFEFFFSLQRNFLLRITNHISDSEFRKPPITMEAIFPTNNLLAQALLGSTRSPRRNPLRPVQGNILQKAKELGAVKAFQSPSKQVISFFNTMEIQTSVSDFYVH